MSQELFALFDLELAWRRAKAEGDGRLFVRDSALVDVVEADLLPWLENLTQNLRDAQYHPSPAVICEVPKGNYQVRPGAVLTIADRVVYAAAVGACLPDIHRAVADARSGRKDFSHQLHDDASRVAWFRNPFGAWKAFREASLRVLDEGGVSYVVIADIAAYYENIDLATLMSDLRHIGAPTVVVDLLSRCLNRWAQVPGQGLPQGHSPSDILAKLYLHQIDENLSAFGIRHFRYVDDIRIFCRNHVEAKRAIVYLSQLLRARGLTLQSAKLTVLRSDSARKRIEAIAPIVQAVGRKYVAKVMDLAGVINPYATIADADQILNASPDDTPIEVIREAYETYFIDSPPSRFNPTLFRFLLNRLGKAKDAFAVGHTADVVEKWPEVTDTILKYWSAVGAVNQTEERLSRYVLSPGAIYSYQVYQILDWRAREGSQPADAFMSVSRDFAFNANVPAFLRSAARVLLGQFGSGADLERLQQSYVEFGDPREQCEIICALRRMEIGRRNGFLSRCAGDGPLHRRAVDYIRVR